MFTIRYRSMLWFAAGVAVSVALVWSMLAWRVFAAPGPGESTVVSVTPTRILDTRDPVNLGLAGPFVSAVSQKLQVTGATVPAGSTGVLLNVTVVGPTAAGFLSIRPGDASGAPSTSSLNFEAGVNLPNAVQVALPVGGANAGQIDITYDAYGVAGPTTDVLIDVVGYTTNAGIQDLIAQLATKVTTGPIIMTYGPGSWASEDGITQSASGLSIPALATATLTLTGPQTQGGVAYTIRDITVCLRQVLGGGGLTGMSLQGYDALGTSPFGDQTDRNSPGCYTLTPAGNILARTSFMLALTALPAGSAVVGGVTATWDTRASLGLSGDLDAASEYPTEAGDGG